MKVFLGGTCAGSKWRDELIPMLKIDSYNPVVPDWNEECKAKERLERETSDFVLYTITPKIHGVYSIAEVIDDSNKRPEKTMLCVLATDDGMYYDRQMAYSLREVGRMVERNGGKYFIELEQVANCLNAQGGLEWAKR